MENLKVFEAHYSARTAISTSKEKRSVEMQQTYIIETPIDIPKSSILSLRRWAAQRLREDRKIVSAPDRITSCCYWDGYIRAIDHILEMENQ